MALFEVTLTQIWNGSVTVEAESAREAMEIAKQMSDNGEVDFTFGEETVDYADKQS